MAFKFFNKISVEEEDAVEDIIFNNVIGFLSISGGAGATSFMCEVAREILAQNKTVCIVDFNPTKPRACYFLDVPYPSESLGLAAAILNPMTDANEYTTETDNKKARILSSSLLEPPDDFIDVDIENLENMITQLSDKYDIVLIDIPLECFSEFCIAALLKVHKLYCFVDGIVDSIPLLSKFSKFFQTIGVADKFNNVIVNKISVDQYPLDIIPERGYNLIAALPYSNIVAKLQSAAYSVTEAPKQDKTSKAYIETVSKVSKEILSKVGGSE